MMRWTTSSRGLAGRVLALAAVLLAGSMALICSTALAGEEVRRAIAPSILTDPPELQPIGRDSRSVELSRDGVTVRVSDDRLPVGAPGGELAIEPIAGTNGAQIQASLRLADGSGQRLESVVNDSGAAVFTDIPEDPGRYRLTVRVGEEQVATTTIAFVAQARELQTGVDPLSTASAIRAEPVTPKALADGEVNADLYFKSGPQASSSVAIVDGGGGRTIAATADGSGPAAVLVSGSNFRPGSELYRPMPANSSGAAAVEAAADGSLWATSATGSGAGPIVVARISAGATRFTNPVAALPGGSASRQGAPAIALDPGESIAVAWVSTAGAAQHVVVSECDLSTGASACDDKSNWSAATPVTEAATQYASPDLDYGPAGDLYVTWWDAGSDNAVEADRCRRTEDCSSASSWNEEATIEDLDSRGGAPLPLRCPIIAAPGGFVGPSPSIAVGDSEVVHISYSDLRDNADRADPTRCTGGGSDASFDSYVASGPAPGALPLRNTGVRLSEDGADDLNDHFLPALSVDDANGLVEASFYSTADDVSGQFTHRYQAISSDDGLSFEVTAQLTSDRSRFSGTNSNGVDYGDRQSMDSEAGISRTLWTDARSLQNHDGELYGLVPAANSMITSAPPAVTPDPKASISFTSEAGRTECSLDGQAFLACSSPITYGPLGNGTHNVRVLATDLIGNPVDPSPATASWRTEDLDPPETTITLAPPEVTFQRTVTFDLTADEQGAFFECSFDGQAYERCRPPKTRGVELGRHVFSFRAVDVGGNADPTPASVNFVRKRSCKQIEPGLERRYACAIEKCDEIKGKGSKKKIKRCIKRADIRKAEAERKERLRDCRKIKSEDRRSRCGAKAERKFAEAIRKAKRRARR